MFDLSKLKSISPLYSYWQSAQSNIDEKNRLSIANKDRSASYLFEKEPYKWEILFQSIIREILNGDTSSIKGLQVILNCLSISEKNRVLKDLLEYQFINQDYYEDLNQSIVIKAETKKNFLRFLRILFAIFTNPYGIPIRREKNHIYEKTAFFFGNFKNF